MAHVEQIDFCKEVKRRFPLHFRKVKVLDIGSMHINGDNRYLFEDSIYTGCDLGPGRNVDVVCEGHKYPADANSLDVVITTEALEHDQYACLTMRHAFSLLRSGGLLVMTCAGPEREEHGTKNCNPESSPFTMSFYKNVSKEDFASYLDLSLFESYELEYVRGDRDLNFWGIKK